MRRSFALILCIMVLASVMGGFAFADTDSYITQNDIDAGLEFCRQYPVKMALDGEEILFSDGETPAVIVKGRTLIPGRALFEAMGGTVTWDAVNQTVAIDLDETSVALTIGSNIAWVNGEVKTLEVPAMIVDHDGDTFGSTMIPVRFTAESLGCEVSWDDIERKVAITSPKALAEIGSEQETEGETDQEQGEEPGQGEEGQEGEGQGEIPVSSPDIPKAVVSFWEPFYYAPLPMLNESASKKLIAVDLGHGGKDCGSIGHEKKADELYEKTANLRVGLYLRDYLKQAGANLYMLRETDVYYTLLERAEMANSKNAQIFVSIHNNSSEYPSPNGTEVHYYGKVDENGRDEKALYGIYSKDIAQQVQDEMIRNLATFDRGIKSSPKLAVLNKTNMPAIIVEGAFLSNEDNFAMIKTDEYAKRYAYSVAKALIDIMNKTYQ